MVGVEDVYRAGDAVVQANRKTRRPGQKAQVSGLLAGSTSNEPVSVDDGSCKNNQVVAGIVERARRKERRLSQTDIALQHLPGPTMYSVAFPLPGL